MYKKMNRNCRHKTRLKVQLLTCPVLMILLAGWTTVQASQNYLVQDGEPAAVIVIQEPPANTTLEDGMEETVRQSIDELQYYIERATGVRLPVVQAIRDEDDLTDIPGDHVCVVIGPGSLTESLGLSFEDLPGEAYQMETIGRYLILSGRNPEPVRWSVYRFVDRYMGVRWLWPGDIGTYVPQTKNITYSSSIAMVAQPPLQWRQLRMRPPEDVMEEAYAWQNHHMMDGDRGNLRVGHGFTHWLENYYDEHPDLFAQERGPYKHRRVNDQIHYNVHLCTSNPKVDDFIIREWLEAGTPDHWNIGFNDVASRYCLCDRCRALDIPANQSWNDIWGESGDMTARTVHFYRRLLDKMRAIHPEVTLGAWAYQSYRYAPPPDTELEGMVISMVHGHYEREKKDWLAWYRTGATLYLRPNWWHTGVVAPNIPLYKQGDFFKFAFDHGMNAFDFDSILGYWGAQGTLYYLIARLSYRPDLSVDDIISEYTDAFGSAKPVIREYLDYWMDRTDKSNYPLRTNYSFLHPPKEGLYSDIVKEKELPSRVQLNNWWILPWLYPDEIIGTAHEMLDRAKTLAAGDGEYIMKRIRFLRDSLHYLEAARDVFYLGTEDFRPDNSDATWQQYKQAWERLESLQNEVVSPHVVWDGISARERDYRPWRELWKRN